MADLPWYEYLIMAVVLAMSMSIGIIFAFIGGRQKTTKEYMNANRSLGVVPVTLSMYMSFVSGITMLGNIAEVHTHGIQAWLTTLGNGIGEAMGAVIVLPMLFKFRVTSIFEVG